MNAYLRRRPSIARFHYYSDHWQQSLCQERGSQTAQSWRWCPDTQGAARRATGPLPTLSEEKRKGNNVKFVGDKLFTNCKRFTPNSTHKECHEDLIDSISMNIIGLARTIVDPYFVDIVQKHVVVILTETWLSSNNYMNCNINGYSCKHLYDNKSQNTRKGRCSGRISLFYTYHLGDKI